MIPPSKFLRVENVQCLIVRLRVRLVHRKSHAAVVGLSGRVRWQRDRNPNQTQKRVDKGGGCREVSGPRGPQTALNSPKTSFAKKVVRVVVPHKTI